MDHQLGVLGRHQDHLQEIAGAIRADDQPTVRVLTSIFDNERMIDHVMDVHVLDTVLARRAVDLHRQIVLRKDKVGAQIETVPVREFRTKLSELLSDVADRRDHVLVTRNGKPAAALVPIDEYEALEETAEILSDSATLAAIEAGVAELARDESITLTALRAELAERRAAR